MYKQEQSYSPPECKWVEQKLANNEAKGGGKSAGKTKARGSGKGGKGGAKGTHE